MEGDRFKWEVVSLTDGVQQAMGWAPTIHEAKPEAMRYGYLYSLDGPVRVLVTLWNGRSRRKVIDVTIK